MVFTFNTSTKEVLEQVVRDPRFQELTRLPVIAPMEMALGAGAFFLFFMGCWLYLSGHIPLHLMIAINSFAIYMSFTPLHDATHRSVSSNRRVNDFFGTFCCLLLLPGITTRIYRYLHLEHHRYAGHPQKDPDERFVSASPWVLPFILAGLDVHWSIWYLKQWRSRPSGERFEFVVCISTYVGLHVAFLLSPYALEFVLCFMLPQRLGLFYVSWFFAHIQHPEGLEWEQAPFQTTVKIKTNRFAQKLLLGQAWHCLHHLAPSVPFYRYERAWLLGARLFEQQGVPTRTLWRKAQDIRLRDNFERAPGWLLARVAKVENVATATQAFELVPADEVCWPRFAAGAHIDIKIDGGQIRQYSLYNSPADEQLYKIAVKMNSDSAGGADFMHHKVRPESLLEISAPRNNFPLLFDRSEYLLVARGIGVTPLMSMAHALYERGLSFQLHIFARRRADIAFHQSLSHYPFANSISLHCNSGESPPQLSGSELLSNVMEEVLGQFSGNRALYLCGPVGFMAETIKLAGQASWPNDRIFSESFVAANIDSSNNQPFEVKIASTGELLKVGANEHLIDVLHANGIAVMCSCTQGVCGSCITPVLDGVPDHRDAVMSDAEREANGSMTVCVSRAKSERLVLDL